MSIVYFPLIMSTRKFSYLRNLMGYQENDHQSLGMGQQYFPSLLVCW